MAEMAQGSLLQAAAVFSGFGFDAFSCLTVWVNLYLSPGLGEAFLEGSLRQTK